MAAAVHPFATEYDMNTVELSTPRQPLIDASAAGDERDAAAAAAAAAAAEDGDGDSDGVRLVCLFLPVAFRRRSLLLPPSAFLS
jgi:hypothetical protein